MERGWLSITMMTVFFTLRYVGNQEKQRHRTLHQNLSGYEGFSIVVVYSKAQTFLKVVHPKRQPYHSYDPHISELHLLTSKPGKNAHAMN
jgi:hypothetical protein